MLPGTQQPRTRVMTLALVFGLGLALIALTGLALSQPNRSQAAPDTSIRYVAPDGTDSSNDCLDSGEPCATAQHAVDVADPGDEIRIAAGTYAGASLRPAPAGYTGPSLVNQALYLTKTVTLRGGYTTSDWTTPDPEANPTVLDALGDARVLLVAGDASLSPVIEGLRLTGGSATGLDGDPHEIDAGGGVFVMSATLTLRDCWIYGNTASGAEVGYGGGVYLLGSSGAILSSTIASNTASTAAAGIGGGVFMYDSAATVAYNTIVQNAASTAADGRGGGLHLHGSAANVHHNAILENTACQDTLSGSTNGWGGGANLQFSAAILSHNVISGNLASTSYRGKGGGLHVFYSPDARLVGNRVLNNTAASVDWGFGGGLYLDHSNAWLENNVVSGNASGAFVGSVGAAIAIYDASPRLAHTTVASSSGGDGSAIHVADNTGLRSHPVLTNTVLADHSLAVQVNIQNSASLNGTLWFNNGAETGGLGAVYRSNDIWGDPAFAGDGYHLTASSAAVDQGVDAGVSDDIDGDTRPSGAAPDLGADELVADHGVLIAPALSAISGPAGTIITHTLRLTNTGLMSDSYDLTLLGNGWPSVLSASAIGPLGPGLSVGVVVTVTIPVTATHNASDEATLTATSRAAPAITADALLRTTARIELPCTPTLLLDEPFELGVPPPGWLVVDNLGNGQVWRFDDPGLRGNLTGGGGGFAIVDSDYYGAGNSQDTEFWSPGLDLTNALTASLEFDTHFHFYGIELAEVDLSIDGGSSWILLWSRSGSDYGPAHEWLDLAPAIGQANVLVRFHYYLATWAWWWQVDNVQVTGCMLAATPTPTPSPSPTATPTPSQTPTPTASPSPTPTATPTSGDWSLGRFVLGSAGGLLNGSSLSLKGSLGQPGAIGQIQGTSLTLRAGFWHAPGPAVPPDTPTPTPTPSATPTGSPTPTATPSSSPSPTATPPPNKSLSRFVLSSAGGWLGGASLSLKGSLGQPGAIGQTQGASLTLRGGFWVGHGPAPTPTPTPTATPVGPPALVGDRVWHDQDTNGLQDAGEMGLAGVTINLLDGGGEWLATTSSGPDGSYAFADQPAGTYLLEFVPPAGYAFSPLDQGADDLIDSDADPVTGRTSAFVLTAGQIDLSRDAGLYERTSLTIGPGQGGTLVSPNGQVQVVFPANAVNGPTTVFCIPLPAPGHDWLTAAAALGTTQGELTFAGTAFRLEAFDQGGAPLTQFNLPYTITLYYEEQAWQQAGVQAETSLHLARWDTALLAWARLAGLLDTGENQLVASFDQTVEFALFGRPDHWVLLPLILR